MSKKQNENEGKWSCKRCTFDNWPKSAYCTLCFAAKNSTFIINKEPQCDDEERDIYKIAPLLVNNKETIASGENKNKWTCHMCTYLNWPKSMKCTQCLTSRLNLTSRSTSPIFVRTSKTNLSSSFVITTTTTTASNSNNNSNISATISSANSTTIAATPIITSTTSSCQTDSIESKQNSPVLAISSKYQENRNENHQSSLITNTAINNTLTLTSDGLVQKWSCLACTYENWPKSTKCVICLTPKGKLEQHQHHHQQQQQQTQTSIINSEINHDQERLTNTPSPPGAHGTSGGKKLTTVDMTLLNNTRNKETGDNTVNSIVGASSCNNNNNTNSNNGSNNISNTNNLINNYHYSENKRIRQMRKKFRDIDWLWLDACNGVVNGDIDPVLRYLEHEGDLSRHLTASEVTQLARPSAFDVGHTLAHLALRFQRHELLSLLLANTSTPLAKRVPSDVSRESSLEIKRHFANCLRQRKGEFPCFFVSEFVTFSLPTEIEYLVPSVQRRLFDELLDRDVQKELEEDSAIINWSDELTDRLGSRLHALWNRSTGDCLLDSALQATWGIFDKDNVLRKSLADSLSDASQILFPRFKEAVTLHPNLLHYTLDEDQWEEDWAVILSLASQPGSALEQFHIFTLAHILRRPIIVYGVKYVKSFRGETLGYAGFEGIYLPLLWESSFCWKSPIALGYTRGHFSALVPIEPDSIDSRIGASAPNLRSNDESEVTYLPLITSENKLLSLHFLSRNELGREDEIMKQYLDCCVTEGGVLVAKQKLGKRPLLVAQMLDDWINYYRNLSPSVVTTHSPVAHGYSSDGDSD